MAKPTRIAPELQNLDIWHAYEPKLRELYLTKNQTLKEVKESMEGQHGWPVFKLGTYEIVLRDELGLVKNLTKDDWCAIKHHVEKRSRDSRKSQVVLHGHVIEQKRITKAIGRYRRRVDISRARSPILRNGLRIQTPPLTSPRPIIPDGLAYIQMAGTATPSSTIKDRALPPIPREQGTILPRYRSGPLSIQTIMDIRTDSPFNQFASVLGDMWSSHISSSLRSSLATNDFHQLVRGAAETTHDLQQVNRANTRHQVIGISDESPQTSKRQPTSLYGTDNYVGLLMQACYMFSNNIHDLEVERRFLDWIGLVAEMRLLKELFRLKLPSVLAVWEKALDSSFLRKHGKAFEILIKIGLEIDNGRLMQSSHGRYFAWAVDLGSTNAMSSVLRFLEAGMSPNARFELHNHLPVQYSVAEHYWRCCALKQAAKNRDVEMLECLLTVGNCRCGKFDAMFGNLLLSRVTVSDPFNKAPPSLQCVEVLIKSGMKIDFLPKDPGALDFTVASLGWHRYGKPEILVDRVFFSAGEEVNRNIYQAIASKSQWAQECVTVSGLFLAAEGGPTELRKYLDSVPKPKPVMKEALLQIALTEAAHYGVTAVLECLLQFGVDPNVNTLMGKLPEEEEEVFWSPVGRAAMQWHTDVLAILLGYGTDFGKYPLFGHVMRLYEDAPVSRYPMLEKRRGDTIQILLDAGAFIDVPPASLLSAALLPLKPPIPSNFSESHPERIDEWMHHIAKFVPNYELCDKLKQRGIDFDRGLKDCNTLHMMIREACNFATVSYLIYNGVPVHSIPQRNDRECSLKFKGNTTMLHDALIHAYVDRSRIVDILLENGADIYSNTSQGASILEASLYSVTTEDHYRRERPPKYRQESVDISWRLFHLMGPRHVCSLEFKSNSFFSYLISLDESDDTICAVFDDFGGLDHYEVVSGLSLLMNAIMHSRIALVIRLVERGYDINLQMDSFPRHNQSGQPPANTVLQFACANQRNDSAGLSIVHFLLENGAEVNAPPTMWGMTALQSAAFRGNLGIVSTLLEHGAQANAKPGTQFLQRIAKSVNQPHLKRYQAVDMAAEQGHLDVVHLLVGAGGLSGNPGVTGLDGAMVAAKESNHTGIVDYLQRHTGQQLTEEMCRAVYMPLSSASVGTSRSSSDTSEYTDGEHSCQCQQAAMNSDADSSVDSNFDIAEGIPAIRRCSVDASSLNLPLRSQGLAWDQPGSSYQRNLPSSDAVPDATTMNIAHNEVPTGLGTKREDTIDDLHMENGLEDLNLDPGDLTKNVVARGATGELTQCQTILDQTSYNDWEWQGQSNEADIEDEECITPITRGILEWIQGADFGYKPG